MVVEKQTDLTFLTDHLLEFGVIDEEPISNMLKLNRNGEIVDNANPEAQQTWTYENGLLKILDEDDDEIANFNIHQDENGALVESTGTMDLLGDETIVLRLSEIDTLFQKITKTSYIYTNPKSKTYSQEISLDKDFSIISDKDIAEQFWTISDSSFIFYNANMTKIVSIPIERFESKRIIIMDEIEEFSEMISKPKVSVVVPVYNVEGYLEEALTSLQKQTLKEIEILVINDGSKDCSLQIIQEFVTKDTRFKLFDVENGGIGKAFNIGVANAKGEYVAEFESDDYVVLNAYEKLYNTAKKFDTDIVRCNWTEFSEEGEIIRDVLWKNQDLYNKVIDLTTTDMIVQVYPWNAIYRRKTLTENNVKWDEEIKSYGDTGLFWKVNSAANNVVFIKESLYYYRQDNPNSTINNISTKAQYLFKQFKLIRKELISQGNFSRFRKQFYQQMFEKYFWVVDKLTELRDENIIKIMDEIASDFKVALIEDKINETDFILTKEFQKLVGSPSDYYKKYIKNKYKVSIVMPVRNSGMYLRKTLDNILRQSFMDWELIVVENGSTDNSTDILTEYVKKDGRISYFSIGESNPGYARNFGIDKARGQYLQFLDSDDEFEESLLQDAYYRAFDSSADIVIFGMREKSLNGTTFNVPNGLISNGGRIQGENISLSDVTPYLYDKMFLLEYIKKNKFKLLEQSVGEDAYFTYTSLFSTGKIISLNKYLLTRIVRKNGLMSTYAKNYKDEFNLHISMLAWLKKNKPELIEEYQLKISETLYWFLFDMTRVKEDFKVKFFVEIRENYFEKLELDKIVVSKYSEDLQFQERLNKIQDVKKYDYETYSLLYPDFGKSKTALIPNVDIQDRGGKIVFGQKQSIGQDKVVDLFSIIIENKEASNISAIIDFTYMGDNIKINHDTLLVSLFLKKEANGILKSTVLQTEWEKGYDVLRNKIYYSFNENIFTIYIEYTERYAAMDYFARIMTSREVEGNFSIVRHNQGYIQDSMLTKTDDMIKIENTEDF